MIREEALHTVSSLDSAAQEAEEAPLLRFAK